MDLDDSDEFGAGEWAGDRGIFGDPREREHIYSVLDSFWQYRRAGHYHGTHVRRQRFYALPTEQWQMLSKPPISYLNMLTSVDNCIDKNANIAEAIVKSAVETMGLFSEFTLDKQFYKNPPWSGAATKLDLDKARSTVHQLMRDWSEEGSEERRAVNAAVLFDIGQDWKPDILNPLGVRVLVPGAGLGRLVFDLSRLGYTVEGNEISYHQLLTSSYILNHTTKANQWPLFPYALSFSNVRKRVDQLRRVRVPDTAPAVRPTSGSMSMSTGDFVKIYGAENNAERFNAVATVFFLDTAPNVLAYINTIWHCLKPGGVWTNVGPLLWHFEEQQGGSTTDAQDAEEQDHIGNAGGFEPTAEEVVELIKQAGFEFEILEINGPKSGYMQNSRSMLQSTYETCRFRARKKLRPVEDDFE